MTQQVVIAGGGLAGLTLALALRRAAGDALAVTLADPGLARSDGEPDARDAQAFAVAAAGRRLLTRLGVWEAVAPGAQPITDMAVTDSRVHDVVRPIYLTFANGADDGQASGGEPFAHMVFSRVLTQALRAACREAGVAFKGEAVTQSETGPGLARVLFGGGEAVRASLVVAAEGRRSRLREAAGIGWVGWDYGQSGIVATVRHERDHGGRAYEHFLPAGPFAVLPLPPDPAGGFQSSIVWTERTRDAETLLSLPDEDLFEALEMRFGLELGPISLGSRPQAWPLSFGMARSFVGPRLALLGDAAHVIHPIAGQGLNLGLRDAEALAEAVANALRLGLDIGSPEALKPYEQTRRAASVAMGVVTDGLNRLFSNDVTPVRLARDLGLGLVDRMPFVKDRLIGEAAG